MNAPEDKFRPAGGHNFQPPDGRLPSAKPKGDGSTGRGRLIGVAAVAVVALAGGAFFLLGRNDKPAATAEPTNIPTRVKEVPKSLELMPGSEVTEIALVGEPGSERGSVHAVTPEPYENVVAFYRALPRKLGEGIASFTLTEAQHGVVQSVTRDGARMRLVSIDGKGERKTQIVFVIGPSGPMQFSTTFADVLPPMAPLLKDAVVKTQNTTVQKDAVTGIVQLETKEPVDSVIAFYTNTMKEAGLTITPGRGYVYGARGDQQLVTVNVSDVNGVRKVMIHLK